MGRKVDLDSPLSEEDKSYLKRRGRGYLIAANERRFGEDGKRQPEEHEMAGGPPGHQFYDNSERERAVYDQGGAPLPNTTLDYNTGRVYDRDNGVLVEPAPVLSQPGAYATSTQALGEFFEGRDDDDSDIDDDIAEEVTNLKVPELKSRLKADDQPTDGDKETLQDRLAIHLQDKRDGKKQG